jgi:hypothetical protein
LIALDGVAANVALGVAVIVFFAACMYALAGELEGIAKGGPVATVCSNAHPSAASSLRICRPTDRHTRVPASRDRAVLATPTDRSQRESAATHPDRFGRIQCSGRAPI